MRKSTISGVCVLNVCACAITTAWPPSCRSCCSRSPSSNSTNCVRPPRCGTKPQLVIRKCGLLRQVARWSGQYGLGSSHEHPGAGPLGAGYVGHPKGSMKPTDGNCLDWTLTSVTSLMWLANHAVHMTALRQSLSTSAHDSSRQRAPEQETLNQAHIPVKYIFPVDVYS